MFRALQLLVVAVAVGALAACSTGSGFTDLDREATSADVLPSELPVYASEDFVAGSVRFAGEHDDAQYYLARSAEFEGTCVVVYESAEEWVGGCGGGTLTIGGAGRTTVVAADGSPELDEGTPVGTNIVVR